MDYWHFAREATRHWLYRETLHSVHSPLIFSFCRKVLYKNSEAIEDFSTIENLRNELLANAEIITGQDWGSFGNGKIISKSVSEITRRECAPKSVGEFYFRLSRWTKAKNILELGTSFGLSTLYLANDSNVKVTTIEGNEAIADYARSNFLKAGKNNIHLNFGEASVCLEEYLSNGNIPDLVIIDANHQYTPTIQYFETLSRVMKENGIILIDDIHSTSEMTKAWKEIVQHHRVSVGIDLLRSGLVLLDPKLEKRLWRFSAP